MRPFAPLLLAASLLACQATIPRPSGVPEEYGDAAEASAAIAAAQAELSEPEQVWSAVARLAAAQQTPGLDSATRGQVQSLLVTAVSLRLDQLAGDPEAAEELGALADLELPRDLSVRAHLASARAWLEQGERVECHEKLQEMARHYPLHARRMEAGTLHFAAGKSLAEDPGTYALVFHYRSLAPMVLEAFVQGHPGHPEGPQAYELLVELYEEDGDFLLATRRAEELLLYFPGTLEGIRAQAKIPQLRLASLGSPEYDRTVLLQAQRELEEWLLANPQHELADEVRRDQADCLQRLADSDLSIARFYQTVGNQSGFEYHARRGFSSAQVGGNQEQLEEARALLAEAIGEPQ